MDELECLIMWPKGSIGYEQEKAVIHAILAFERVGLGRISQIAAQMMDMKYPTPDPISMQEKFMALKRSHFKQMGWDTKELDK